MSIRVAARVRPLSSSEVPSDTILRLSPSTSSISLPNPRNDSEEFTFSFASVYPCTSSQSEIFDAEVAPSIKTLFSGIDVVLFAYGVTGTGKTHTMRGGKSLADRGMIPRALSSIFRKAKRLENDENSPTKVSVSMSYFEIYNDKVFDLFEPIERRTPSGLPLRDNGNKTVVVGLSSQECTTLRAFEALYDSANQNRSTGSTKLNAHSSRSHAIVAITLSIHDLKTDTIRRSTFSAIDLAGSEDNRRTENTKERMVESSAINKSLFVLSSCVEAIAKKDSRIPYRESKMTRILSLGQNDGHVIMILNLAPSRQFASDTLSSLNFATRTKSVSTRERENEYIPVVKKGAGLGDGKSVGVAGVKRQPLRPLCNNLSGLPVESPSKKAKLGKGKSFAIYSDRGPTKSVGPVPALKAQSAVRADVNPTMTKETTEAMIDSKLSALSRLVPKAEEQPVSKDEDLLSRLARLERQVLEQSQKQPQTLKPFQSTALISKSTSLPATKPQSSKPSRSSNSTSNSKPASTTTITAQTADKQPGIDLLVLAKSHLSNGRLHEALTCYVNARAYYPGHTKLEDKIAKVQARIQARESEREDGEYVPPAHASYSDEDEDEERGERGRVKKVKSKPKVTTHVADRGRECDGDNEGNVTMTMTPRTQRVLEILNAGSVLELRKLKGVGVKKAESLFSALQSAKSDDGEGGGGDWCWDLQGLERVQGVSGKMLDSWRAGVVV